MLLNAMLLNEFLGQVVSDVDAIYIYIFTKENVLPLQTKIMNLYLCMVRMKVKFLVTAGVVSSVVYIRKQSGIQLLF